MPMLSGKQMQRIREKLADLYRDEKDHIPLIAEDIELKGSNLYSDDIILCCHRICKAARKQGKLIELLERVHKDHLRDVELLSLLEMVQNEERAGGTGYPSSNQSAPLGSKP